MTVTALRSWSDYLDAMKPAGDLVDIGWFPKDQQYRADMYRQLMMNIGYAYASYFQSNETHPDFMPIWNSLFTLQPNPDDTYLYTPIDGRLRYRIFGDRGSIHIVNVTLGRDLVGLYDKPGPSLGMFEIDETSLNGDGKVDILLSAERPEGYDGAWQRLPEDTNYLIIRQRSYDWGNEVDSRFAIECLDAPGLKRTMPVEEIAERLDLLTKVPERWSRLWLDWTMDLLKRIGTNVFEHNGSFDEMGAVKRQVYTQALVELEPGEALILETELPEERPYWNFQFNDPAFHALEIVYRQTSLNGHTAHVDSDGRFRAVVSVDDPGVPNWFDTCGYRQGSFIGRWLDCSSAPVPTLKRVPFAELRAHLPADTPVVTPEQRAKSLRERHYGAQLRRRW